VDTARAYALLDGPRTDTLDHARFWLDRFGAPRRIRNALGHETVLTRRNATYPALVTRVRYANGRVVSAEYDPRGNLLSSTDSSTYRVNGDGTRTYAVTRYAWHPTWDFLTRITLPEGEVTQLAYDPATGNRLWQKPTGDATRADTVHFRYYAGTGLLRATDTPLSPPDSLAYDGLGNLSSLWTPKGFRTEYRKDAVGRDTLIVSPIDSAQTLHQRQRLVYDGMDRIRETRSWGPEITFRSADPLADPVVVPAETLTVRNYYNPEGAPDSLSRWASPDPNGIDTITTRWRYDRAGRRVAELAPGSGPRTVTKTETVCADPLDVTTCTTTTYDSTYVVEYRDSTEYDPAGNPVRWITRRGDTLTMEYDTLSRLKRRIVRGVSYAVRTENVENEVWHLPRYRDDGTGKLEVWNDGTSGLTIPADTAIFTYDEVGNLRKATNRDAEVSRGYYPNGALRADTLKIRTYAGADFSSHVYGLRFEYDLNGRRTLLEHPGNIAPRDANGVALTQVLYAYHDTTGQLQTITDLFGDPFEYQYDREGRPEQLTRAALIQERWIYDADGRLERREETTPWAKPLHADTLLYEARAKVARARTRADSTANAYSGLGSLVWSYTDRYLQDSDPEEIYRTDALANLREVKRTLINSTQDAHPSDWKSHFYERGTGRLITGQEAETSATNPVDQRDSTAYDAAGNKVRFWNWERVPYAGISDGVSANTGILQERTSFFYDAEQRLRVVDKRSCVFGWKDGVYRCFPPHYNQRGAFEEYRYDALGRRILVRTRQEQACENRCNNSVTRAVWDGDQLLYEMRYPGRTGAPAAEMEQDTGYVPLSRAGEYGRVAYTHGQELDQPLALARMDYDTLFAAPQVIYPHATWRGVFDSGTFDDGSSKRCVEVAITGEDGSVIGTEQHCVEIDWPAPYLWMSMLSRRRDLIGPASWMGSLVEHLRDATGQYYRRNRYYEPSTGRFTQEDPIGLAGGLNVYGFAEGDPVNYSDPFGLCRRPAGLRKGEIGICIESFIARFPIPGVADNRGSRSDGGTYRTSVRLRYDPAAGTLTGESHRIGKTLGFLPAWGRSTASAEGGTVMVEGWGMNTFALPPWHIDYAFSFNISKSGDVELTGYAHEGYPSYEVWIYEEGKQPRRIYYHREQNLRDLRGDKDDIRNPR
jgi:RHS repeat-associated protein